MTRKIYSIVTMTALFLLASTNLWAASSGKCGDNVTWSMDDQSVMTIEGTGAMTDYDWGKSPFKDLRPKKVIVKGGVTAIGTYAFQDCMGLADAEISGSVTSIGECAFSGCQWLTSITLPETLTSIDLWAFNNCMGLTSITIPGSVKTIGEYAFKSCSGLTKIVSLAETPPTCGSNVFNGVNTETCELSVPKKSVDDYKKADGWKEFAKTKASVNVVASGKCGENVTWTLDDEGELTIEGKGAMENYSYESPFAELSFTKAVIKGDVTTVGEFAFYGCNGLASVEISGTVTSIGEGAFSECAGLKSVTISSSVTSIGGNAFDSCSGLTSITLPGTVTSIGDYAFSLCINLTSITIPASVTTIGDLAFNGCTKLTKIESLAEEPPVCGGDAFKNMDMSSCVLYVPKNSIDKYKGADEWKAFTNIEALSDGTESGTCGDQLTWTLDAQGVLTIEGTGAMNNYEVNVTTAPWKDKTVTKAVIKEGVTTIGEFAFCDCTGLTSVTVPSSVTSIGAAAFLRCTGLTSVEIPNSVTGIGEEAFSGCAGLKSVTLSNSLTEIAGSLFHNCQSLTSVTIPNSVKSIGKGAFYNCTGLTSVTIPNSVTSIGSAAFGSCTSLTGVTIPAAMTSIEKNMFIGCSGLKSVTIPASVENIGAKAFNGCTGLMKIESLAEVPPTCGSEAFDGVDKEKCELSVPKASISAYQAADVWKEFNKITAGINGVSKDNDAAVSAKNGAITVTGTASNAVTEVYSTSGALVYRGTGKTVAVPSAGVYVVRAAGKTFKVNAAK